MNSAAVQRGFATTSIPTKKAKAKAEIPDTGASKDVQHKDAPKAENRPAGADPRTESAGAHDDSWDNDEAVNRAAYQALVERLQEKGDKEVARITKAVYAQETVLTRAVDRV